MQRDKLNKFDARSAVLLSKPVCFPDIIIAVVIVV